MNRNQTLELLNTLCGKRNITPKQLLQDDGGNQEHNSSDSTKSTDSQEKAESPKKSVMPHQGNSDTTFSNKQLQVHLPIDTLFFSTISDISAKGKSGDA